MVVATASKLEDIDVAMLRPGRLDIHIPIGLPPETMRSQILRALLRDTPLVDDKDQASATKREDILTSICSWLAPITHGASAASLKQLCQEAALASLREDISARAVAKRHFKTVLEMR